MDNGKDLFKGKLEKMIETKSKTDIALHFGISRQSLYKWFKRLGIDYKSKTRFMKSTTDYEFLNQKADELLKP